MKSHKEVNSRLLTVTETAEALGLKESTIRAWVMRRKLPFVKLGRSVRIPENFIDELVRTNTVPVQTGR